MTAAETTWRPSVNPWIIAACVMLATFIEVLDTTIVSVALPHMAGSLGSTNEEATWVLTSYLVANAVVLPASGWLAIRFGRTRFLLACVAMFTMASVLCGMAVSMPMLVLARVLQGFSGGALQPLSQSILLESFPPAKRGMAMAAFGVGVVVAPVIGPTLGGWLTDNYSWRWVFNINIPFGILAFLLIREYVEDPPYIRDANAGRLDSIGFGLLALWLATLQIVLDRGQQEDWFASSWIAWFSFISVGALIALVWWELHTSAPIVDLRVFLNRNFWVGTLMMGVFAAAMYSSLTVLPLFLESLLGYTSQASGLATSPRGIGALIAMPFAGYLMERWDARHLLLGGIVLFITANVMLTRMSLETAMSSVVWPNIVMGLGMGFVFVPLMSMAMATLKNEQMGNASGLFNLLRNVGGSVGISVATTYIARTAQAYQSSMVGHLSPYEAAFQMRLAQFQSGFASSVGPVQAQTAAYGMMQGLLLQQATLRAFLDTFLWTAAGLAVCIPLTYVMRKVVHRGEIMMH